MLRLYYGRESVDKDRIMYDQISRSLSRLGSAGAPGRIILVVSSGPNTLCSAGAGIASLILR